MTVSTLISDHDQQAALVHALYSAGYCPYLVSGEGKGKAWITALNAKDDLLWKASDSLTLARLQDAIERYPGAGVSIDASKVQDSAINPVVIDVDCPDDDLMDDVRCLLPRDMPGWRGRNAGSLMGRSELYIDFRALIASVDPKDKIYKGGRIHIPHRSGSGGKKAAIDLMHQKDNSHCLLPPTLHADATHEAGTPIYYEWLEGTPRLTEVSPRDLPIIQPWHLLSVHQLCKNPTSAFMQFIREWGPGDFHDRMVQTSAYLLKEGWTPEHVASCLKWHVEQKPDDKTKERLQAISVAVMKARADIKEAEPSQPKGLAKMSPDAEMVMWLDEQYPLEDTAVTGGTLCWWNEGHWQDLLPTRFRMGSDPTSYLADKLHNYPAFAGVRLSHVKDAAKFWVRSRFGKATLGRPARVIPFANGVYDPVTDEFRPEQREDYIYIRLSHDFIPEPNAPIYNEFLHNLVEPPSDLDADPSDHEVAYQLVNEWFGHSLLPEPVFQKALFVIGPAGVGKSETAKLAEKLMPPEWYAGVPADRLDSDNLIRNFDTVRLNVAGEMRGLGSKQRNNFLAITGGDPIAMKTLYENSGALRAVTRLMFFGNLMEHLDDVAGDIQRRLMILRTTDRKPPRAIPNLHQHMLPEASHILSIWAKAVHGLMARQDFLTPAYSKAEAQEAVEQGGPFNIWLSEYVEPLGQDEPNTHGTPISLLYMNFQQCCEENGYRFPMTRPQFKVRLNAKGYREQSITRIGGRTGKAVRPYRLKVRDHSDGTIPAEY